MNKDKVAIFVPSMRGGGAERAMLNLAIGLQERGLTVEIVLAKAQGPYLSQIPPEVKVINLGAQRVLTSLKGLVGYLKKEQPASLLSAMRHANVIAILAGWFARVNTKIIVIVQNTVLASRSKQFRLKDRVGLFLAKLIYFRAQTVVAVSQAVAAEIAKLGMAKLSQIKIIPNPVITSELIAKGRDNPKHKWFIEKDIPVLLSVGRLTAQKDFGTLLRAFRRILEQRPARLIILGEGEERGSLEKLIKELNLEADVAMPGFVENPYAWMAKAKIFVLSSAWEGLPTVLIEALALGVAVVATDSPGGSREILQGGRLGKLVPVGDWERLAAAIIATLDRPGKGIEAEELKIFTREAVVGEYFKLLKS
ncbi:MAG: glycosyltransferase [Candidatus Omnitrophica bacterium]|nr:glycosyltransferase [Candidatus Omnitrophota bacterium]